MSEYMQKRWVCDICKRDVKRGVMPPPGWYEILLPYGNAVHCCADDVCVTKLKEIVKAEWPSALDQFNEAERAITLRTGGAS